MLQKKCACAAGRSISLQSSTWLSCQQNQRCYVGILVILNRVELHISEHKMNWCCNYLFGLNSSFCAGNRKSILCSNHTWYIAFPNARISFTATTGRPRDLADLVLSMTSSLSFIFDWGIRETGLRGLRSDERTRFFSCSDQAWSARGLFFTACISMLGQDSLI